MQTTVRLALAVSAFASLSAFATDITGAGATFPYPLYAKWAATYAAETGKKVNYQSIGSGGGIKQITAKTVDFGASDMPLKPADLQKAGLVQFPTVIGGIVPVVNIPGIKPGELKFTGKLLADIYLGKVTRWNAAEITKLNPGVKLPNDSIFPVRRADGSGTTFIFTNYLSKISPEWTQKVGNNTSVQWPGNSQGGKGNEGVANFVSRIKGSIGYVEYVYAKQNNMTYGQMQNADGKFVLPTQESFKAAAANADWARAQDYYLLLTDQPGARTWPIAGATFVLMHKTQDKPAQGLAALKFFEWAYKNGDATSASMGYIPLPASVKSLIQTNWKQIGGNNGKPLL